MNTSLAFDSVHEERRGGVLLLIMMACVTLIDGYDLAAMPILVTHLAQIWDVPAAAFGVALSGTVAGIGLGGLILAPLGERIGRRTTILVAVLAILLSTAGTAFAGNTTHLLLWRVALGLAVGACLPHLNIVIASRVTPARRARTITLIFCGIPVGGLVAGLTVPLLTRLFGWRSAFLIPTLAMLPTLVVFYLQLPRDTPAGLPSDKPRHWLRSLGDTLLAPLKPPFLFTSIAFSGIYIFNSALIFMLSGWLPTLLQQAGVSFASAGLLSSLVQAGGLLGGPFLSWAMDRERTAAALGAAYLAAALALVSVVVMGESLAVATWTIVILVMGIGIGGVHLALTALANVFYPRHLVIGAIGFGVGIARIGAVAGPLVGAHLIAMGLGIRAFFLAVLVPLAFCLVSVAMISRLDIQRE